MRRGGVKVEGGLKKGSERVETESGQRERER